MEIDGDHRHVLAREVPESIMNRLAEPHSKERPRIPFAWMVSYSASGAIQNIGFFENGVRHCKLDFPIRVFFSNWTDAIVVTFVPLEAIREPHVLEWYPTFYELPVEEARRRLQLHPKFPYDGRNPDLVRAEMMVNGGPDQIIENARAALAARGIDIPSKW